MGYPKKFYEELKSDWTKSRTELQNKRKKIDDQRNEFYRNYYELKNGIKTAYNAKEGTRPKQNRERKFERDKIDSRGC